MKYPNFKEENVLRPTLEERVVSSWNPAVDPLAQHIGQPETLMSVEQRQALITSVKILLQQANLPASDVNIAYTVEWIRQSNTILDLSKKHLNETDPERRKLSKEFRRWMHKRAKQDSAQFKERVHIAHLEAKHDPFAQILPQLNKEVDERMGGKAYTDTEEEDIKAISRNLRERGFVMEKPQGSSLHHFNDMLDEWQKGRADKTASKINWDFIKQEFQSFVIEHDWASAFKDVKDFDGGEIRLPFQFTCFEFRISGMRVLCFLGETDKGIRGILASGINKRWYINPNKVEFKEGTLHHLDYKNDEIEDYIVAYLKGMGEQIRAACIMLDAKVAYGEKRNMGGLGLNKQRARDGKNPIRDYHVVSLMKRLRSQPNEDHEPTGIRRKLHWRRGHWRHFKSAGGEVRYSNEDGYTVSKTWINWQLVGDETLGFVDKHYKL